MQASPGDALWKSIAYFAGEVKKESGTFFRLFHRLVIVRPRRLDHDRIYVQFCSAQGKEADQMDRVRKILHAGEAHRAGVTGMGVTAAILDSGCSLHPDYRDRLIGSYDFVNGRNGCYDDASHGTHVAGILAGDGRSGQGRYRGIAPGCRILGLKVLDRFGQGELEQLTAAVEWCIENRERYRIRILNLSAGTAKEEEDARACQLVECVERAWDAGIVVVVAAGNRGPDAESITVPGNSRKVITVGSSDGFPEQQGRKHAQYSGCGPTRECICKPELVCPGTRIVSCHTGYLQGRSYAAKSGTSMAAPAVAGAIALLLQQEPYLTNVEVKMRMRECAADAHLAQNRQGWGIPDLRRLLRL